MVEKKLPSEQITNLQDAVRNCRKKISHFRDERLKAIRSYVGYHFANPGEGSDDKIPINLMEMACTTLISQLAAANPVVSVDTTKRWLKPQADTLELAINKLLEEIDFKSSLSQCVVEAFFGMGIMKTGINQSGTVEIGGFLHDVGQPYAESVSIDDFCFDIVAKKYEQCQFVGNRFRITKEDAENCGLYDKEVLKRLQTIDTIAYDEDGTERAETLSLGIKDDPNGYKEYYEFWEIWLPPENLVVTVSLDISDAVLRTVEWGGPEYGPYRFLKFVDIPDSLIPLPLRALWIDLHDLANKVFVKLGRQAERQRSILGFQPGFDETAALLNEASDGDAVPMSDPSSTKEYRYGGPDNMNLAFFLQIKELFSYLNGNLDVLGGLGAQTETVGQDTLLARNASKRVSRMQDITADFATAVIKDLAFYLWEDPLINIPLTKRVPGFAEFQVETIFSSQKKEGSLLDYDIKIEAYSLQRMSPAEKLAFIERFIMLIAPLLPMWMQMGVMINPEVFISRISKLANMPELNDIFEYGGEPLNNQEPTVPSNSPVTKRVNERISRSASGGPGGGDQAMMQSLLTMNQGGGA